MDGNGSKIRVYALTTQENAYYSFDGTANEDYIYVGLLEGKNLSALDIVAHEYTHGIVRHTSNLAPNNEPGALDESFADIFGALIERYSGVPTWTDWLLGEEAQLSTTYTRNMETPNNGGYHLDANCNKIDGQPDTYAGTWWYSGSCQAGGRHVNSGVQNKWFNLLINGGTHNGVTIQNIGIDRAERIAYLTMFNLNSNAQFADARSESISQARKNYGKCSNEEIQVTNAWAAVGVGQTSTCAGSSLDEINQSFDINIYPNPVKEELQIEIIGSLPSSITIINSIGCVVMSINPLSLNSKHINVGIVDIAQGVYFLQAKGEHNETMRTIKFIKN